MLNIVCPHCTCESCRITEATVSSIGFFNASVELAAANWQIIECETCLRVFILVIEEEEIIDAEYEEVE